jgi:hypothetical protein
MTTSLEKTLNSEGNLCSTARGSRLSFSVGASAGAFALAESGASAS